MNRMVIPKKAWLTARKLTTAKLQMDGNNERYSLDENLFSRDITKRSSDLFLGFYSEAGIKIALNKYGILKALKEKGFDDVIFKIDTIDPYVHRLVLYNKTVDLKNQIVDVVLRKDVVEIDFPFECEANGKKYDMLVIEWMLMQDPKRSFTKNRAQLPGQKFPGLGLSRQSVEILSIVAWRLKLAGVVNIPEYLHNAIIYSRVFYYMDPNTQALLEAVLRDLKMYSLSTIAWAYEYRVIKSKKNDLPLEWKPMRQILPLESGLKKALFSKKYRKYINEKTKEYGFYIDMKEYEQKRKRSDG
jgi:hypothetical protein